MSDDGYTVELGGQMFTQDQWEALQPYIEGRVNAEVPARVLALADEFDAQVPWPHSWIGNRIREAAGVEQ